jgi:ketosteroid isomerase-like protein
MTRISALVLVLGLAFASACAPKVNDPADVQLVKQTMEAYTKAILAKDAPASVAMLTDTTAYLEPHMPAITGKDAVAKFHQGIFDNFDVEMAPVVTDVQVQGNLATMRGTFTQKLIPKAEGLAAISDTGNWTVAARRQADGAWKWDWIMGGSDQPMPGSTADGVEEQAIAKIERDWTAAMAKGDEAALGQILAKEWVVTADGQTMTRAQSMAAFKSGAYKMESARVRDLDVHVFGDAAVATMLVETKATFMGQPVPPLARSTDFFVKRDGRWQAVSTQNTTITQ